MTQGFAYALPVLSVSFLVGPLVILQGIYAKHFGLGLSTIATVLLISRLFDAISDPVIGYFSDRYQSYSGSRKPLIVCGGVLLVVASYFLYVPPDNVSTAYFLSWFLTFIFAFTLFEVPHLAWANEIVGDSREKNKIYGWRACCVFSGALIFFSLPLLPVFETNEFTPESLRWSVLVAACLMGPMLYVCMTRVPNSRVIQPLSDHAHYREDKQTWRQLLVSILGNTSLLWFFCSFFFVGIGTGMWATLLFLFVDSFLDLGEYLAGMYVISYGVGAFTLTVWTWVANRWGKQKAWSLAMIVISIGIFGSGMLSPLGTDLFILFICTALVYSGFAAWVALAPSLLADIIDYSTWKFGPDRAGTYFSLYTLVSKMNWSIGGALALGIAGWYGFDATTTIQSEDAIFGLRLAMVWLPVPLVLVSIVSMLFVPINSRRHSIIRRRLDVRAARIKYYSKNKKCPNFGHRLVPIKEDA